MPNILDYLDWRGDLEFNRDPINEVDNLVFSVLSYMDFAGAVPALDESGSVALSDACETLKLMPDQVTAPITSSFFSRLPLLLDKCAASARYRGVRLSNYSTRFLSMSRAVLRPAVFPLMKTPICGVQRHG